MSRTWLSPTLLALAVLVWGYFVLSGFEGIAGIAGQHVPGYPNEGQRTLYLYVPLAMFGLSTILLAIATLRRWGTVLGCAGLLLLAALLPFLTVYGGGV